jgi:DNA-binding transcriptional LysR family regulator
MNWDDVRVFLAIARAGHILGAAKRLRLNHATVARRLSALEAALQTKLFVRRPSGCNLTDEGERLLVHAERMESEMLLGFSDIGHSGLTIEGTVRIGAPDGFGVAFLAPRLGQIKAHYPRLLIQLVPVSQTFSLARRDADIAITIGCPEEGRLIGHKLTDYQLGFYASQEYLDRAGTPSSPDELAKHVRIGSVEDLNYSLNFGRELVKDWKADIEISSTLGRAEAVRAGAGIGILQCFIADQCDNLVHLFSECQITRSYWIVSHEDMRDIRRISIVSGFITSEVNKMQGAFYPSAPAAAVTRARGGSPLLQVGHAEVGGQRTAAQ